MRIQLLECAFPPALLQGPTFWRCDVMRGSCNGFLTEITLTPVANRWEWKIMWWWRWWSLIVNERQSGWFVQNHCWGFPGPWFLPRRHQKHTLHQHYRNEHGEWFIPLIKTAHIQQETSDWHTMVFLHAWNDLLTSLAVNIWLMLELMLSLPDLSALQRSNTAEDQHNNWSEKTLWWRGLVQDRLQPEVILVIICDRRSKDDLNLLDLGKAYRALSKLTLHHNYRANYWSWFLETIMIMIELYDHN